MKLLSFFCLSAMITLTGCGINMLENTYQNTITENFNALWNEFDLSYGAFIAKRIQWDSLKTVYSKNLTDQSSERELFNAMSGLLSELNDGHVYLNTPQFGLFESWNRRDKSCYADVKTPYIIHDRTITIEKYLQKGFRSITVSGSPHLYGVVNYRDAKIGYLLISSFETEKYNYEFIQDAVDAFRVLDGIMIDLRFNAGGQVETSANCLNSFACEPKIFKKAKFRNGPSHNDFTKTYESWIKPHKNCLSNKPIALLINSFTCSASETFILGMKTQSHVITVGDTSHGAFSMVNERILPNGWLYSICSEVLYNPDGSLLVDSKGNYLEGIGIAPDYYVPDYYYKLKEGIDITVDTALSKLFVLIKTDNNI